MKKDFLQFLDKKKIVFIFTFFMGSFLISELSRNISGQQGKLSNLKEGIQTCFVRVSQTYTAKTLGEESSNYMNQAFMSNTEECFGEAISQMEEHFEEVLAAPLRILNTMSSDAHWFHERLSSGTSAFVGADIEVRNFGHRFSMIEDSKIKLLEGLNHLSAELKERNHFYHFLFILFALTSLCFLFADFLSRKRESLMKKMLEKKAEEMNRKGEKISPSKVLGLLFDGLDVVKFTHLSKLMRKVGLEKSEDSIFTEEKKENVFLEKNGHQAPRLFDTGSKYQNLDEEIKSIWDGEEAISKEVSGRSDLNLEFEKRYSQNLDIIHLDNTLSKVVQIVSDRLFTRGIILDFNIDEALYVYAEEESLEQVLYQVFMYSFQKLEKNAGIQKIQVSIKKLGGSLVLCFEDNGASFSESFMKRESGLLQGELEAIDRAKELEICSAFMHDFGGSLIFENIKNEEGLLSGKKMKLVFKTAKVKKQVAVENKLRMVKKTTKRELLKELSI